MHPSQYRTRVPPILNYSITNLVVCVNTPPEYQPPHLASLMHIDFSCGDRQPQLIHCLHLCKWTMQNMIHKVSGIDMYTKMRYTQVVARSNHFMYLLKIERWNQR